MAKASLRVDRARVALQKAKERVRGLVAEDPKMRKARQAAAAADAEVSRERKERGAYLHDKNHTSIA